MKTFKIRRFGFAEPITVATEREMVAQSETQREVLAFESQFKYDRCVVTAMDGCPLSARPCAHPESSSESSAVQNLLK